MQLHSKWADGFEREIQGERRGEETFTQSDRRTAVQTTADRIGVIDEMKGRQLQLVHELPLRGATSSRISTHLYMHEHPGGQRLPIEEGWGWEEWAHLAPGPAGRTTAPLPP